MSGKSRVILSYSGSFPKGVIPGCNTQNPQMSGEWFGGGCRWPHAGVAGRAFDCSSGGRDRWYGSRSVRELGVAAEGAKETRSSSSALLSPFFFGEGSLTKIDYRKKGTLIQTSLLEDLGDVVVSLHFLEEVGSWKRA